MSKWNQKQEHILICLSSSPTNTKIIQTAGQMAEAYQGTLTALYVETSHYPAMEQKDRERLQMNMRLARKLGATLVQVKGDDISYQIAEFARLNAITKIVIGQSRADRNPFGRQSLTDRLMALTPKTEIFIIPDGLADTQSHWSNQTLTSRLLNLPDLAKTLLSLAIATGLSLLFYKLGFTDANIITVYLLGVLLTSIMTEHIFYSIFASLASVITFNFFFTDPRYTLWAYDIGYPMTFLVMFLASLITGTLASKLKFLAKQSTEQAYRTQMLLDTNQALQQARDQQEIVQTTLVQLTKLTGRMAKINLLTDLENYNADAEEKQNPVSSDSKTEVKQNPDCQNEVFQNAEIQETDTSRYYPLKIGRELYGNVEIDIKDTPIDDFENSIILSILGECAMALENERSLREKEEAAILVKNEQLRANLLRTISHDLRTPLTSISGNASNLMKQEEDFSPEVRRQLYGDIYDDSMWLISLVENLLSVTRMEGQGVKLNTTVELLEELVSEALRHLDRRAVDYEIKLETEDEFIMVRADARLIMQVIINLVNNAIKYTPAHTEIHIRLSKRDGKAEIVISDRGPGIPDDKKEQVFELFYSGDNLIADGRRSMGLGLALCKSIVNAHHGSIVLDDNPGGGARFTITLPTEEVVLHE